jgi:[CysO sulfur-carrier protein]-thiocarboxylate-dependent cysteine synthase
MNSRQASVRSILHLIGNTPLVDLSCLSQNEGVRLWAKLESFNPCGSVKDRPARQMLLDGISENLLRPGMTILEATSGNTGTALACIGRLLGYSVELVVPEVTSATKLIDISRFGAHIRIVPGHTTEHALEVAYELSRREPERYFLTDQYTNSSNPKAHYLTTGPEIVRDCPQVTHFVAAQGSFGTLGGVSRYFREQGVPAKVFAVVARPGTTTVFGMKQVNDVAPLVDDSVLSGRFIIDAEKAMQGIQAAIALGYHVGPSSGAVLAAAIRLSSRVTPGNEIVCLLADGGIKYPGSKLYDLVPSVIPGTDMDHLAFTEW